MKYLELQIQRICLLVVCYTVFGVADYTYIGHSLAKRENKFITNNGRAVFMDYTLQLPNGTLAAFQFRTVGGVEFPPNVKIEPFSLQVWQMITGEGQFPLKAKLVLEKYIRVSRAALGQVVEVPLCGCEKINVTSAHRIGIASHGSHCVINLFSIRTRNESYNHAAKGFGVEQSFPEYGTTVIFEPFPRVVKFQIGVLIDKHFSSQDRKLCNQKPVSYELLGVQKQPPIYVGHPLTTGTGIPTGGFPTLFMDWQQTLQPGRLLKFYFRAVQLQRPENSSVRLLVWELLSASPLKAKLVFEKRTQVPPEDQGKVVQVPVCHEEAINITSKHRFGIATERPFTPVDYISSTNYSMARRVLKLSEHHPEVGDEVQFSEEMDMTFIVGVTADSRYCKRVPELACAAASTPPTETPETTRFPLGDPNKEYYGNPLQEGSTRTVDGRGTYVDISVTLSPGRVTGFKFRTTASLPKFASQSDQLGVLLQIWEQPTVDLDLDVLEYNISMKLLLEKKVCLRRDQLNTVIEVPLCGSERLDVTAKHRLGMTTLESYSMVAASNLPDRSPHRVCLSRKLSHGETVPVGSTVSFYRVYSTYTQFSMGVFIDATYQSEDTECPAQPGDCIPTPTPTSGAVSLWATGSRYKGISASISLPTWTIIYLWFCIMSIRKMIFFLTDN